MHTVIKNIKSADLKERYPLAKDYFCESLDSLRIEDSSEVIPFVLLVWNKDLMKAKHMNELAERQSINFDTADEYINWKNKNGEVEL